ncbi:MAG: flagellar biosynthetic protein FliQ [Alphaproteobacteria bacterium]|nr:flagellar biosynthetic protein FliQ [Alphaproteobacteria bacterium]MDX5368325.1 flagellar biosynthetic protein FliQ [Alphaproteobacteria bacterium]MDX5463120.1 flagellar biosynthetic protein FliQ [Alphaproteobacteria bacterium]
MDPTMFSQYLYKMALVTALYAGPPLLIATGVGFIIALFQALTQIQDQMLPQAVKLLAVGLSLLYLGAQLSRPLVDLTVEVFRDFPHLVQ